MGFVANFIRFPAVQNVDNRLRFDKVTESSKVGTFFETQCTLCHRSLETPNIGGERPDTKHRNMEFAYSLKSG